MLLLLLLLPLLKLLLGPDQKDKSHRLRLRRRRLSHMQIQTAKPHFECDFRPDLYLCEPDYSLTDRVRSVITCTTWIYLLQTAPIYFRIDIAQEKRLLFTGRLSCLLIVASVLVVVEVSQLRNKRSSQRSNDYSAVFERHSV